MLRVYKKTGQARDEGVSIKRSSTPKEFKGRSSELTVLLKGRGGEDEVVH